MRIFKTFNAYNYKTKFLRLQTNMHIQYVLQKERCLYMNIEILAKKNSISVSFITVTRIYKFSINLIGILTA